MKLDTATIVVISVVVDAVLMLILLHTWRTRTTYAGFITWIAGTACWSVGSFLAMLLPDLQPQFIPKILGNALIMLHPLLLYEGLMQFHGVRRRWWGTPLNVAVVLFGVLNQLCFLYVADNIMVRSVGINLVMLILFTRIFLEPLLYPRIRRYSMQWLLSACLLPLTALIAARIWTLLSGPSFTTFPAMVTHDNLLRWICFYGICCELFIAYSFLSLTSERVEEELRAEKRKLSKTVRVSDGYQAQLQELNSRTKEQAVVQECFLDMVSHEYRTPLAIIQANIDVMELKDQRAGGVFSGSLHNMQHAVDRLIDVFEATRRRKDLDLVTLDPLFEAIEVDPYVKETLAAATVFWGERFVFLNDLSSECRVYADRRLLRTVLLNLLDNAAKYSPPGLQVTLQVALSDDRLELAVRNRSSAPLPDDTEALFRKFSRGSNSADTGGTGQGLYLARGIVEQHGGSLTLMLDANGDVVATLLLRLAALPEESHES